MGFYKIIVNNKITDVVKDPIWVKEGRNGLPVRCDVHDACGILDSNQENILQIAGAHKMSENYERVSIADITEQEYEELKIILEMDGAINDQTSEIEWPKEPGPVEEANLDLVHAIERKIEILSACCQAKIMAGIDVEFPNKVVKHFDLTVEDQLNLMIAQKQEENGAESVLFKASGEDLSYYVLADIDLIAEAAARHITYHRAYFESLRKWVRQSQNIIEVGAHYYGEDVPEEFRSEVYKTSL